MNMKKSFHVTPIFCMILARIHANSNKLLPNTGIFAEAKFFGIKEPSLPAQTMHQIITDLH